MFLNLGRRFHNRSFKQCVRFNSNWKVLFFGSDNVSLESLRTLKEYTSSSPSLISKLEAVTHADTNKRGKVSSWCKENQIPVHYWNNGFEIPSEFDIGIVVSFGYLIPARLIESFPKQMINVHPSLLPKYRGSSPIAHTLLNNDNEGGVSIITLHPTKFDMGKILIQESVPVGHDELYPSLEAKLAKLGAQKVIETLQNYDTLLSKAKDQPKYDGPRARKLTSKDANINWIDLNNSEVYGRHKAMPGKIHTFLGDKCIRFVDMKMPTAIPSHVEGILGIRKCVPDYKYNDVINQSIMDLVSVN
eukprot:TRINITY_DN4920_c0_g1_i1.p1 TRINITY_DN4920_c0_g1~~TRINITY_DN4920_c0_g1_i1.p1  ORF type:complete len:303 (-),score=30.81 TRINITY_DN4920_c0_g1_i1:489-1397(-)